MIREPTQEPGPEVGRFAGFPTKRSRNTSARTMRKRRLSVRRMTMRLNAIAFGLIILIALPAIAHHSFDIEFDSKKTGTITGVVTKVDWINPHAYIHVEFKEANGAVKNYRIELGPPYSL